jgi:hypothetical protein
MKNLNFVIPFFFKGAPRESVMLQGELRIVKNKKSEGFGKVRVYTDSHFEPLNFEDCISLEDAKKAVQQNGGIWVKENFDILNVEDLREIKSQLSEDWVKSFNEWYNSQE